MNEVDRMDEVSQSVVQLHRGSAVGLNCTVARVSSGHDVSGEADRILSRSTRLCRRN
jgi:hypothetical protein